MRRQVRRQRGRTQTILKTSFCEVTENFSAYSVLDHRHVAEVLRVSGLEEPEFSFTAHLLPLDRGILETIYVRTGIPSADDLLSSIRGLRGELCSALPARQLPDLRPSSVRIFAISA